MGKVFRNNCDNMKTAYVNWLINKDTINNMIVVADGYIDAALILAEQCLNDNEDRKADNLILPMLFQVNHAIELYLKSINIALSVLLDKNIELIKSHDIKQIYDTVISLMSKYETDKEQRKELKKRVKELNEYIIELYENINLDFDSKKPNMEFSRYPITNDKKNHFYVKGENVTVDIEEFYQLFKIIGKNLSNIASHYHEQIRLRYDNL